MAFFALVISASAWLPWLTTAVNGGGWANAIGGTHGNLELSRGFGAGQLIVLLASTLLVAGAMVADAAMRALSLNELEICPWALREGVILRRLDHTNGADELAGQGSP